MLQHLQHLYEQHGWLSAIIIDEAEGGPGSGAYRCRFGSLIRCSMLATCATSKPWQIVRSTPLEADHQRPR